MEPIASRTIELAISRGEGHLTAGGAFLAVTSPFTGRSPNDKFVVQRTASEDKVWWGKVNQLLRRSKFDVLEQDVSAYLNTKELFMRDVYCLRQPGLPLERAAD